MAHRSSFSNDSNWGTTLSTTLDGQFLHSRQADLVVGDSVARWQLSMGVPQGSPISPILFAIFIDTAILGCLGFGLGAGVCR